MFKIALLSVFLVQAVLFANFGRAAETPKKKFLALSIPYFLFAIFLIFHGFLWDADATILAATKITGVDHGYFALGVFAIYFFSNVAIMKGCRGEKAFSMVLNLALLFALLILGTVWMFSVL